MASSSINETGKLQPVIYSNYNMIARHCQVFFSHSLFFMSEYHTGFMGWLQSHNSSGEHIPSSYSMNYPSVKHLNISKLDSCYIKPKYENIK
jgi:hypothetical protein